jgi:hypothetical protein
MGEAVARHSLRPFNLEGDACDNSRAKCAARMLTCGPLSFQYPRDISNQHDRPLGSWSPGPAFAKGFGKATSSRARRSFSEGGEPGEDRGVAG